MSGIELRIEASGEVRAIYSEQLDVRCLGSVSIRRGSYVEPTAAGQWSADLGPVGGPVLGPFDHRSQAIAAEIRWLRIHWLNR
jgi:hypothetical protein